MSANDFITRVSAGEKRFAKLHISDANLTDLRGYDLVLRGCTFEDCDFSRAQLEGLHSDQCCFIGCKFNGANLREAAFTNATFYRSGTQTEFVRADLRLVTFTDCDLRMCDFERAELFRAEFSKVNALGTNFFMASFKHAVKIVDSVFRYAVFTGVELEKCVLTNNIFIQAVFQGAKLAEATLIGCDLSGANWQHADVRGVDIRGANAPSFDLRTMDLTGVKILASQQTQLLEVAKIIIFPNEKPL